MKTFYILNWFSLVGLILLLTTGCRSTTAAPIATAEATPLLTPITTETAAPLFDRETETYAVYSAAFASAAPHLYSGNSLVILEQTQAYTLTGSFEGVAPLSMDTLQDYQTINRTPQLLKAQFDLSLSYTLMSEIEHQDFRSRSDGWVSFTIAYPGANGYLTFSGVGFNQDGNEALLKMDYLCVPLCGRGNIYVLANENAVWQVRTIISGWIS